MLVGSLGDGGHTIAALKSDHGLGEGTVDFVSMDHDKAARIADRGWLRDGAVVVADNVKVPGAPAYCTHMRAREGGEWQTTEHKTHVEYQTLIKDSCSSRGREQTSPAVVGVRVWVRRVAARRRAPQRPVAGTHGSPGASSESVGVRRSQALLILVARGDRG